MGERREDWGVWGGGRTARNFGGRAQRLVGGSEENYLEFGSVFWVL